MASLRQAKTDIELRSMTISNVKKAYSILAEDYNRLINLDFIYCPHCGKPMTMNLRCDDTFVEDEGWHQAYLRYQDFIRRHQDLKIVYLELGVGQNTPGIIKYPFFRFVERNKEATYICINKDAYCPRSIEKRAYCINEDIKDIIDKLYQIQCTND